MALMVRAPASPSGSADAHDTPTLLARGVLRVAVIDPARCACARASARACMYTMLDTVPGGIPCRAGYRAGEGAVSWRTFARASAVRSLNPDRL
jgi:hypothetical protein